MVEYRWSTVSNAACDLAQGFYRDKVLEQNVCFYSPIPLCDGALFQPTMHKLPRSLIIRIAATPVVPLQHCQRHSHPI